MKLTKAPELLKKAATSFRCKTEVLRTKLIILASLRRRMALASVVSRRIHALMSSNGWAMQGRVGYCDRALMLRKALVAVSKEKEIVLDHVHGGEMVSLPKTTMFDIHGSSDWTDSLFDDEQCYVAEDVEDEDDCVLDALDEPSVIEVIKSNRELEGLEFNMDEDIDEACDMFIRSCHLTALELLPINTLMGLQDEAHASKLTCCLIHLSSSLTYAYLLMPSLSHCNFLIVGAFDKQLHQLSTSKMKISKAPELLKKAVTVFKVKTDILHTKLLILASFRRRMSLVGTMSRRIQALVSSDGQEKQALVLRKAAAASKEPAAADHEFVGVVDLSGVAIFDEDDHGYPDWTHSLFDDKNCYNGVEVTDDGHDDYGVLDALGEASVIDIIRSNREVEGLEFNMDEQIDEACDMFIKRFRKRMNQSF
ncbi:hypothetical protein EJB05_42200, partial [Eragrostis curvula]